jgi:hypothetical protein
MSIEKIERDLRQAIDDFSRYPASDERCRGALLEFKATCSTENIRALLDELSRLREALMDIATSDDIDNALDPARNKRIAARIFFEVEGAE